MKQSIDVYLTEDQKDWKTDLSLDPSLLERLAKQLSQNFKTGSFDSRKCALTAT